MEFEATHMRNKHENAKIAKKFKNRSRQKRFRKYRRSKRHSHNYNAWNGNLRAQLTEANINLFNKTNNLISCSSNNSAKYFKIKHHKSNTKSRHEQLKHFLLIEPFLTNSYFSYLKRVINQFEGSKQKRKALIKIIKSHPNKRPTLFQTIFQECNLLKYVENYILNIVNKYYDSKYQKNNEQFYTFWIDSNDNNKYRNNNELSYGNYKRRRTRRGWYNFGRNRWCYDGTPEPVPLTHITFDRPNRAQYQVRAEFDVCITNNTDCKDTLMIHSITVKVFESKSQVVLKQIDCANNECTGISELSTDCTDEHDANDHDNDDGGDSVVNGNSSGYSGFYRNLYMHKVDAYEIVIENTENKVFESKILTQTKNYENLSFVNGFKCNRTNEKNNIGIGAALAIDSLYENQYFNSNPYFANIKSRQCQCYLFSLCQLLWIYTCCHSKKKNLHRFAQMLDFRSLKVKYLKMNKVESCDTNNFETFGQSLDQALGDLKIHDKIRDQLDLIPFDIITLIKSFIGNNFNFDKYEIVTIEGCMINDSGNFTRRNWSLLETEGDENHFKRDNGNYNYIRYNQYFDKDCRSNNESSISTVVSNKCMNEIIDEIDRYNWGWQFFCSNQMKRLTEKAFCNWQPSNEQESIIWDERAQKVTDDGSWWRHRWRQEIQGNRWAVIRIGKTN